MIMAINQADDDYAVYDELAQHGAKCTNSSDGLFLYCYGFTTWPELMAAVKETNNQDLISINGLHTRPIEAIVLTGALDLHQVCKIICENGPKNSSHSVTCQSTLNVNIAGLKGLDVASEWAHTSFNQFSIELFSSFFYRGNSPGQYQCNEKTMIHNLTISGSFFTYFNTIIIGPSVQYDKDNPVCPFLFTNAGIDKLEFNGLVDSFLVSNLFKYQQVNYSSSTIDSSVFELTLEGYSYSLNELLLHRLVFEKVENINLEGMVGSIQPDLFNYSFGQITDVFIRVDSLANFFHQVGLEWTRYLSNINQNIWISFEEINMGYNSWLHPGFGYTYPNSDLCIFAHFVFMQPQQKKNDGSIALVVPIILTNFTTIGCTDSAAWLTQGYNVYTDVLDDIRLSRGLPTSYKICWNKSSYAPDLSFIKTKISQCSSILNSSTESIQAQQASSKTYTDYNEVVVIFQFVFDLLSFVLIPLACVLGLLLNARVIWTVLKKGKKDLNEDFYKYMALNSIFNCLFCFIYAFYPTNYCLRYETGYFCSTIFNSVAAQVVKIVFIGYFGEVLKMCSSISYILITINRYILVGKEHNFVLTVIAKWSLKHVIRATVVFSLLINIGHCFQYRINYGWAELLDDGYENKFTYDLYPSIVIFNFSFQVYSIVYFVISFVVFFCINTFVEASLVMKMRKEIAEKRDRIEEEIRVSAAKNLSCSEVVTKVINSK
jgi:hypothetical protein